MIKYSAAFLLLILSLVGFQANSTEILRLFYTWEDTKSFLTHGDQIDVVLPFFYDVNKIGDLEEEVDSKLMSYSKEKGIKVMPVIINLGFSRDSITELLKNKEKQGKVQIALLEACKKNGFWGIQFDFEGIPTSLKQEYSTFVANTAELFHKTGFKLSVTVIPNEVKDAVTPFVKWHMEYWRGGIRYFKSFKFRRFSHPHGLRSAYEIDSTGTHCRNSLGEKGSTIHFGFDEKEQYFSWHSFLRSPLDFFATCQRCSPCSLASSFFQGCL